MENCRDKNNQVDLLKLGIHKKFMELRSALLMREKLLYRQLEVVASTKQHLSGCGAENNMLFKSRTNESDNIQILFEEEAELLRLIRSFGRFQLGSMVLALKQEDYITPNCDHEIMYKTIQSDENQSNLLPHQKQVADFVLVDFSKDKSLIEHNVKYINDSIVNITLEEAKELIRRTHVLNERVIPQLNLEELDDDLESPIVEAVSNLSRETYTNKGETISSISNISNPSSIKRSNVVRTKPKVTINNCNGVINLRNISSVTINCNNEKCEHLDNMKVYKNMSDISELSTPRSFHSSSNESSHSSFRSQLKKAKKSEINTENQIQTKKKLNQHIHNVSDTILLEETLQTEPQLILKNFENLNIFLKNDRHNEPISSVHIEHWLSEIIKETDLEPMQNNEILEHSQLK